PQHVTVREAQLPDPAVGRCCVDRLAVGRERRRGVGDPVGPGELRVRRRREPPQHPARVRVKRLRATVRGGDQERIAAAHALRGVDRRGVDRPVEADAQPAEPLHVRGGDRGVGGDAVARGVVAEPRPVAVLRRGRAERERGGRRCENGRRQEYGCARQWAVRSGVRTQGPGGVRSDSAWRYARPARGRSLHRSKQKYRRRQYGKNLRLKLCSRSTWNRRSALRRPHRTARDQRPASSPERRKSANTAKLSETSVTALRRAHASVSVIRNSISPFGVSPRRRIEAREYPSLAGDGTSWRNPPTRPSGPTATASTVSGYRKSASIAIVNPRSGQVPRHSSDTARISARNASSASAVDSTRTA